MSIVYQVKSIHYYVKFTRKALRAFGTKAHESFYLIIWEKHPMKHKKLVVFSILIFLLVCASIGNANPSKNSKNIIYNKPDYAKIKLVLDVDVFKYFNLENKYDSELKKKYFMKSKEYEKKKELLENKKKTLLNTTYTTSAKLKLNSYNISNGYWKFLLNEDTITRELTSRNPDNTYESLENGWADGGRIYFENIPVVRETNTFMNTIKTVSKYMPLKMREDVAYKIEQNLESSEITIFFKFTDKTHVGSFNAGDLGINTYYLGAYVVRVVIINKKTRVMYYDIKP